ncbi:MAG: hypothetical protein V4547_18885 [Bacteroidota bacterium]
MKKVIITTLGASLKCNPWKQGEVVEFVEVIANHLVEKGFAENISEGKKEEPAKTKKK